VLPDTHQHLTLPSFHPVVAPFRAALEQAARPGWLLRCRQVISVSPFHTHIAGTTPFMPFEMGWPGCTKCGLPLAFVWQIDFADFSGSVTLVNTGLFQFFYCWECFPMPSDTFGWACRWFPDFSAEHAQTLPQATCPYATASEEADRIGPYEITAVPFLSLPAKFSLENPIPHETQNEMVGKEEGRFWAVYSFTKGLYLEDEMISRIGGYPPWVQFQDDTPICPICGARMVFVGAVGSDDTDLIWGDSGYWYFFACKATPACKGLDMPLMAWQCY
jgi:uncharacterized protein YwqG